MTAFAGVRVLDFARGTPGSLAAMLLADYGAEVLKVHAPQVDDPPDARMWGRNKKLLALDLAKPADVRRAEALLAGADVAIFDTTPNEDAAHAFNEAVCRKLNPALVRAWLPPYGHAGDESELPIASHLLLSAMTAVAFRQGSYADQPVCLIAPLLHYGQGVLAAASIAASLIARKRNGAGRNLRVSGLDTVSQMNGATRDVGASAQAVSRPVGGGPHYRLYSGGDGKWLFLGSLFPPFIDNARIALGMAPREGDGMGDEPLYIAAFATKTRDEWVAIMREAGVPCAPVGENADWFKSEPVAANALAVRVGDVDMPGLPAQLSATPGAIRHGLEPAGDVAWDARAATAPAQADTAPLAGFRVLDMGVVIAGASAGAILSNLGADVLKIEGADGDPFRSSGLVSAAFNRGKRAFTLDLKNEKGKALFLHAARGADVVLDNFRLGVRTRLGIDYPAVQAVNPRIVSCSITAYGRKGARAPWPGFDPLLQAESGLVQRQGGRGKEPVYHQIAVNDVASAAVTAFSILAALHAREANGAGQEVITSLASQSVFYQARAFTTYPGSPEIDDGDRDCIGTAALKRFYQCADGWIAIDCRDASSVAALQRTLGVTLPAHALSAERFSDVADVLAVAFASRSVGEIAPALRAAGVAATKARRSDDSYVDPYLAANAYFLQFDHKEFGRILGVTGYGASGGKTHTFSRPSPLLGEHTREVLKELGKSDAEIDALVAERGVFVTPQN